MLLYLGFILNILISELYDNIHLLFDQNVYWWVINQKQAIAIYLS